jgi:hypothetical protein
MKEQLAGEVKDELGEVYGRLTVVKQGPHHRWLNNHGQWRTCARWICRCECGTEVLAQGRALRSGNTSSCQVCNRRETRRALYVRQLALGLVHRNSRGELLPFVWEAA